MIFNEVPWATLRVGNQKPAIGFEHLVSSRFLPFMERSYNQDSFYGGVYNGFLPGMAHVRRSGEDDYGTWNIGLFKPTDNVFAGSSAHDGDFFTVARLTHLLWYYDEGASLFHVGGSAMRSNDGRGPNHLSHAGCNSHRTRADWPVPASTGTIGGDDISGSTANWSASRDRGRSKAEYLVSYMTRRRADCERCDSDRPRDDVLYHGGYAQVLYFLTGEHDNYDKASACSRG